MILFFLLIMFPLSLVAEIGKVRIVLEVGIV